jgi:predicted NUDIX family NTP pyrophosphohydrolase
LHRRAGFGQWQWPDGKPELKGFSSMKQAAGTLLYRDGPEGLEVLLVHSSGPYNRRAPWSIPKGEPDAADPGLEDTARRETWEETGVQVAGPLAALGFVEYRKSRKRIHCYAGPAPHGADPRPASWEVDQAGFLPLSKARQVIHPDQAIFLNRLVDHLDANRKG